MNREAITAIMAVNGVELYVETIGAGDRVVLVHGSWGDATTWDALAGLLAERFEVVTYDRRGHSRSGDGHSPGSLIEDAQDLGALIQLLGPAPAHVVGNSYGSSVALALTAAHPDLVVSTAVHEPPLFGLLENSAADLATGLAEVGRRLGDVVVLLETGQDEAAARCFVDTVAFGPGAWDQLGDDRRQTFVRNAHTFLDERRDEHGASIDAAALASSTVPMLLSHGTQSPPMFPAVIAHLATLVPQAQVCVLDGAGHVPQLSHPAALAASLIAFYGQLPAFDVDPVR